MKFCITVSIETDTSTIHTSADTMEDALEIAKQFYSMTGYNGNNIAVNVYRELENTPKEIEKPVKYKKQQLFKDEE